MQINKIYKGDCKEGLKLLPDEFANCIVTSPPYYGLRDYGVDGQIGLEETPEKYISRLVEVFREAKRVLRNDGTLWVNIGDSYAGNSKPGGGDPTIGLRNLGGNDYRKKTVPSGLKPKDLIGIPWMLAFALRADGWFLRQDIIWNKPNPMPESVTDRCTKSHEYIFLLSKSQKYYYDGEAIKTPLTKNSINRLSQDVENQQGSNRVPGKTNGKMKAVGQYVGGKKHKNMQENVRKLNTLHRTRNDNGQEWESDGLANKRSVWTVTTKPFAEAHFATFPEDLIVDCIKAGCPIDGIVLDPFMGAGTTALVARKLNRNYIGYELNADYIAIAEKRLQSHLGMFI